VDNALTDLLQVLDALAKWHGSGKGVIDAMEIDEVVIESIADTER
jgi:hypothetical protein